MAGGGRLEEAVAVYVGMRFHQPPHVARTIARAAMEDVKAWMEERPGESVDQALLPHAEKAIRENSSVSLDKEMESGILDDAGRCGHGQED